MAHVTDGGDVRWPRCSWAQPATCWPKADPSEATAVGAKPAAKTAAPAINETPKRRDIESSFPLRLPRMLSNPGVDRSSGNPLTRVLETPMPHTKCIECCGEPAARIGSHTDARPDGDQGNWARALYAGRHLPTRHQDRRAARQTMPEAKTVGPDNHLKLIVTVTLRRAHVCRISSQSPARSPRVCSRPRSNVHRRRTPARRRPSIDDYLDAHGSPDQDRPPSALLTNLPSWSATMRPFASTAVTAAGSPGRAVR